MNKILKRAIPAVAFFILSSQAAATAGPSFTYEGRAFDAGGNPLQTTVYFKIQIRSPGTESCLMYQESRSADLSGTNGFFTLAIHDGSASSSSFGGSVTTFSQVFANAGTFTFPTADCAAGTTYAPGANDGRSLVVSISTDGSHFEALPAIAMGAVPFAIEAGQVGGLTPDNLMRTAPGIAAPSFTVAEATELKKLVDGSSTQFMRTGGASTSVTSVSGNITLQPTGGTVVIPNTDPSTAPSSGALVVNGGVGVGGAITAAGPIMTAGPVTAGTVVSNGPMIVPPGSASAPMIGFNGQQTGLFSPGGEVLGFATAGTERMRLDQVGRLGIGTNAPQATLDVAGSLKLGATGTAVQSMGACRLNGGALFAVTSSSTDYSCSSIPSGAVVHCSPASAPGSSVTWSNYVSSPGSVRFMYSGSFVGNVSWNCAWTVPM